MEVTPTLKEAPRNAETEPGQGGQTEQKVPKMPRSRRMVLASPELLPSSGPDGQFQIRTSHRPPPGPQHGLRAPSPLTSEGCRWPAQCSQTGYRPMPRRQRCVWGMREVTSNGHLGPPRCRQVLPTVPWDSVSVTSWGLATRREQRPGGASSRTGWCWGSSQGSSWPGPHVKREAGSGGGSERAGGAPRRSGKKAKALIRMWREQGSAPSPGRRMEGDTRAEVGVGVPRGLSDPMGKGIPAHHPLVGPPYIDSAQVKPLLETQQHGAVAHWPAVEERGVGSRKRPWVSPAAGGRDTSTKSRALSKPVHNTGPPHPPR